MRARWPLLALLFLFSFAGTAEAIGGRMETKRERLQKEKGARLAAPKHSGTEIQNIYEAYLKEDFSGAEALCVRALEKGKSGVETDEVRYLQALCLLKMRRSDEARSILGSITASASPLKDQAALSFADSFTVDGDGKRADVEYRRFLSEYGDTDMAAYARSRLTPSGAGSAAEKGFFSVQVGSFSNESNARSLIERLVGTRYDAYLENHHADSLYRVRVGRLRSGEEARALEARLKKEGYPTKFVSEPAVS